MRPRIRNARRSKRLDDGERGEAKDGERQNQNRQHGHLDVVRFDFLAQIFWSATYHQPSDEHREDYEDDNSVQARTHAAKNHFSQHDIDQWHHASEWRKRIMLTIYGATTGVGRHRGKKGRVRNSESNFLPLHVSAGLQRGWTLIYPGELRIATRFCPIRGGHAGQK